MEPPRILLIGGNGQVGWELQRTLSPLGKVAAFDQPHIDLANPDSILKCVAETRPRIIVNAAAYTAVDRAESEPDRAMKINGLAPGILAEQAGKTGALLVHYSTEYVFNGARREPYLETDPPDPLNVYGRSKLAGEEAVRAAGAPYLLFRLSWVYATRGQNFLLTIMRLAREREFLRVVDDQKGAPTWARLIAEATALAVQQALTARDIEAFTGVYHLAASGVTSWHGFARAIVNRIPAEGKKCRQVEAIPSAEYPTPARRPAWSVLNCGKLQRIFGLRLPPWEESLKQVLET